MPLKDDVFSLRDKAKWKADQQVRLLNLHRSISQQEDNIKLQKARLADATVKLFYDGQLTEEPLIALCQQIQATFDEIDNLKAQEEATRNEKPPENLSVYSSRGPSSYTEVPPVSASAVGTLVCPVCGRELRGRFCPVHGVPGVERQPAPTPPAQAVVSSGLVCPTCGRELSGQFCPADGSRGVPKPAPEPPPEEEPPTSSETPPAEPGN
jgi:hypothetical protein